jgi:hypothetical protein
MGRKYTGRCCVSWRSIINPKMSLYLFIYNKEKLNWIYPFPNATWVTSPRTYNTNKFASTTSSHLPLLAPLFAEILPMFTRTYISKMCFMRLLYTRPFSNSCTHQTFECKCEPCCTVPWN